MRFGSFGPPKTGNLQLGRRLSLKISAQKGWFNQKERNHADGK